MVLFFFLVRVRGLISPTPKPKTLKPEEGFSKLFKETSSPKPKTPKPVGCSGVLGRWFLFGSSLGPPSEMVDSWCF